MPMDFPDMESLIQAGKIHNFRLPDPHETEAHYRKALADHVQPIDLIESMEIRTKKGWDKFNEGQSLELLVRGFSK